MTPDDVSARRAYEQLYEDVSRELYWWALRATFRDRDSASDLVQETFKAAWMNWSTLVTWPRPDQRAWLFVVIRNKRADWYKKAKSEIATEVGDLGVEIAAGQLPGLADIALTGPLIDQCIKVIETMPLMRRAVLELSLDNWDNAAIAAYLRIAPTTVRDHYSAGARQLAQQLGAATELGQPAAGKKPNGGTER